MDAQPLLVEVSANILQERQKDKVTLMSLSDEHKGTQVDQRLVFVTLLLSSSMLCQLREKRKVSDKPNKILRTVSLPTHRRPTIGLKVSSSVLLKLSEEGVPDLASSSFFELQLRCVNDKGEQRDVPHRRTKTWRSQPVNVSCDISACNHACNPS